MPQKFFANFKMSFLTLYHTMTGADMMVDDVSRFVEVAERYQELVREWLHNFVYEINRG